LNLNANNRNKSSNRNYVDKELLLFAHNLHISAFPRNSKPYKELLPEPTFSSDIPTWGEIFLFY